MDTEGSSSSGFMRSDDTHYELVSDDNSSRDLASDKPDGCSSACDIIVPGFANLSAAYNFGIVDYILQSSDCGVATEAWVSPLNTSASFVGAVFGQVILGYAGDIIGRRKAMMATLSLIIFGALASGLLTWNPFRLSLLLFFRFILGIGLGGTYPLSAVSAGESSSVKQRTEKVAKSFSYQVWGSIVVVLIAAACLYGITSVEWKWRTMAIIGAIPSLVTFSKAASTPDSAEFEATKHEKKPSIFEALMNDASMRSRLIGTGGSWFFFDITTYGVAIFQPVILESVLKLGKSCDVTHIVNETMTIAQQTAAFDTYQYAGEHLLGKTALITAGVNCIGIPSILLSIYLISDERLGRKNLQLLGFVVMGTAALCLGISYQCGAPGPVLLFFYIMVIGANWFGVALTTYLLPQETYPAEIKSGMNGLSAAIGKIGAAVGTAVFAPLKNAEGLGASLYLCTCASAAGFILTWFYVIDFRPKKMKKNELELTHERY